MMSQTIFTEKNSIKKIDDILDIVQAGKYLLVCDDSFQYLSIKDCFLKTTTSRVSFRDFTSNPLYEDVCKGVDLFREENCDSIIAVGGGSTIDVAKCIKLFCRMDPDKNYLTQEFKDSGIPLIAIPTTAGTGSESTRYAVIYYNGKKQSITHESIIPSYVILEPDVLKTLSLYQKKCTMLDALCQGIESWWSVNSTEESKRYSRITVETIMRYKDDYLKQHSEEATEKIMLASNYSGKAINITQTTAPHAMSYKLTALYNLPHGHAVAICLPYVWSYMLDNMDQCVDPRGAGYLKTISAEIAKAMDAETPKDAVSTFFDVLKDLQIENPVTSHPSDLEELAASVNPVRLKNNPVYLGEDALRSLYYRIVRIKE